ncbi:diguanylate cyclase [Pseudomonas sp. GOM6]|uniref:diguanylate cyclase domain-containing protein n=1 Tax=Pseudomonas sp. GOM6 TaxID=3036944 RepID=UPI0024093466|nr:diguanylate cyclase [Pseudomonas sp. GOM6]MDG1582680.1 diguanylate cyclase [Pseudomonas sp. GOM6]
MFALLLPLLALTGMVVLSLLYRRLQQQQLLLERLEEGVLRISAQGLIKSHNPAARSLLGSDATDLRGHPLSNWLPPLSAEATQSIALQDDEGRQRTLRICRIPARIGSDELLLLQPQASTAERERFQRSQYFARIGTWDWDIDTDRLYWSEAIYAMFGYRVGEVTPSYQLFCDSVHPDDRAQVRAGELRCIETGENHDEEYRVIWPDGSIHWLRETGNVIKDARGQPLKMMGVVRDITEEKANVSQLHRLAHHDPLTGLYNRLRFEEHLREALQHAQHNDTRAALVFIDLNGFKAINDDLGHAAGDQVLVEIGKRLKQALRDSDRVARLGGDEFVALLEGLSPQRPTQEEAAAIAAKLLAVVLPPINLAQGQQKVGVSLGIALYPEHGNSIDRLLHSADQAMYQAKRSGDNQYRLARPLHVAGQEHSD